MDVVLGVSMAPAAIRMALVEGEDGDGLIVDEDSFQVARHSATSSAPDQVIAAILGTREGAVDAGLQLSSIGVTWTDRVQAAALRDALAAYKIENVMLVSGFLAAAATRTGRRRCHRLRADRGVVHRARQRDFGHRGHRRRVGLRCAPAAFG